MKQIGNSSIKEICAMNIFRVGSYRLKYVELEEEKLNSKVQGADVTSNDSSFKNDGGRHQQQKYFC